MFKIPKGVLKKIISLQRKFYWGRNNGRDVVPLMNWNIIQSPKAMGGLGVGDLQIKNASMLFKWWWRFSVEHKALWKRIICSIHELNPEGMFRSEEKVAKFGLWKSICSVSDWDTDIGKVTKQGIRIKIGKGNTVGFWEDLWIGKDKNDCHIWAFDKSECYTAKTFVDAFYNLKYNGAEHKPWFSHLWKGLAPPKYEIILWAILWNKVNTKDRMLKWKEMAWEETMCTFCGEELETAKHLFLHCRYSWELWTSICEAWDMAWICPGGIDDAFLIWCDSHFVGFEKRLWDVFFIAIVTIIWELRNEAFFENKTPNWPCIVDKLGLTSVLGALEHLTALESLSLVDIDAELDLRDMPWSFLHQNLRSLELKYFRTLRNLPKEMMHLTALENLYIGY
ncbi:uncharacterized protein LOC141649927 [Silene latifolia]|uniref:uncharacterized protein LOC141649927 n=1 Tax=Silene latifolia TaxID=37657 RepID=UPI003D787459